MKGRLVLDVPIARYFSNGIDLNEADETRMEKIYSINTVSTQFSISAEIFHTSFFFFRFYLPEISRFFMKM